jgi:hypothetical protein
MIKRSNKKDYTSTLSLLIRPELPFFIDYYSNFARATSMIKIHGNIEKKMINLT